MFPVKHTVIYTFFAITSVQNTCFCSVFNALASKNPAKSCYVQCFFHFWPFFHCRKATKMTQNSISIPSCAQTPKNPRKMSKTPPYSGLGAKPFLGSGLGAKPFLAPPPAKADIATAILTNVIEHLVLLLPPNKHAFTAKAVWADLCLIFTILFQQGRLGKLPFFRLIRYGKTKDTIEPFWDESAERLERWWLQLGQKINGISQWKSAWW